MRLPSFRFTIRRMMIAVAIVAAILATAIGLVARSRRMQRIADAHYAQFIENSQLMPMPGGGMADLITPRGQWHKDLVPKYARAARYPWLPVAPDPPERK